MAARKSVSIISVLPIPVQAIKESSNSLYYSLSAMNLFRRKARKYGNV